jgi:hypothetical protein
MAPENADSNIKIRADGNAGCPTCSECGRHPHRIRLGTGSGGSQCGSESSIIPQFSGPFIPTAGRNYQLGIGQGYFIGGPNGLLYSQRKIFIRKLRSKVY